MKNSKTISSEEPGPEEIKPIVLLLLDGLGIAPASEANAISLSQMPVFSRLVNDYPVALLNVKKKSLNARYLSIGAGCHLINENYKPSTDLSKLVSEAGYNQIKISETERLAALTYFFNAGREEKLSGEDWEVFSSRKEKEVAFSALNKISLSLKKALKTEKYKLLVVSIPSLDIAAQTEDLEGIIKTAESLDKKLAAVVEDILDSGAILLISAACGNAENIKNMATDLSDRKMTDNPVPLIIAGEGLSGKTFGLSEPLNGDLSLLAPSGGLEDITPTILELLDISVPVDIKGVSLWNKNLK